PWLTVAGALPLAGAIVISLIPALPPDSAQADRHAREAAAKWLALAFSLATLVVVLVIAVKFQIGGPNYQFTEDYSWISQFGVHYALGVDGIALVLIAMTAVLVPTAILASWHDAEPGRRSVKTYFALILVLETMVIGVFAATDVFLFYVFFEAMLVPMYFMIGSYGVGRRQYAAVKFLLYGLLGGLLMLVALIALYVYSTHSAATGHHGSFLFSQLIHVSLSPTVQKWLFLGFFISFAIKAPLWPFHTWLPDAAASARPGAAVLLVGVMDKVGTFGMLRYCFELFPAGAKYFTPLVITLSVIAILYGAVVAIGQADMMRLVAYTSISHFGFIVLGVFAMTSQGVSGATLYMVNHGFATGALFILVGFLIARRGTDRIADFGGVQKVAPLLSGLFLVAGMATLSLPGLS
ncbi:MAG: NADH-quinone oxidoreductase subunit M, partial [Streptosporangiaceae bacterium]